MKTIAIDFDGTLCKKQSYGNGYIYEMSNEKASDITSKLHEDGYKIVIYTTRLNPSFGGDIEWKKQQIITWCDQHGIYFDEITCEKPEAVAYIDDRAIRFTNWQDISNYFLQ